MRLEQRKRAPRRGMWRCLPACVLLWVAGPAARADLKAGVAAVNATPPLEMQAPLGGYGERMNRPAEGVHDTLWAKALMLDDGTRRFCLVTLDQLGLPRSVKESLMPRLAAEGWTEATVMILPSHTHTGPEMMAMNHRNRLQVPQLGIFKPELLDFMVQRLAEVIRAASRHSTSVRFGVGSVRTEGLQRNRRGAPEIDPELTVVRIDRNDGTPLAALVQFTGHPTIMTAQDMHYSGDWPGYLQREMEALIGGGAVVMYFNGAEGDQSVIAPDGGSRYEQAERFGRQVAIRAWRLYETIRPAQTGPLAFTCRPVELPPAVPHRDYHKTGGQEYGLTPEVLSVVLNEWLPRSAAIHALRLGDLVIAGVPGEMTAELGLQVKARLRKAGAKHPVIGGLANEWISYMLSPAQYERGGYEASVSFYGPSLGPRMVEAAVEAAERLLP